MRPLPTGLCLSLCLVLLSGCGGSAPTAPVRAAARSTMLPLPGVVLPASALLGLVPSPEEAPRGMVPLLKVSGPRDQAAVAAFSKDAGPAGATLAAHGFVGAYVVQYADPLDGRVLAVVASRFRDAAGAAADLTSDEAAQNGTPVTVQALGQDTQARRGPLPGKAGGELFYLRFRSGSTTWLLAYGARPTADPAVAVGLARTLLARATTT